MPKKDSLGTLQKTLYIVIASTVILTGSVSFCWSAFLAPKIDDRIDTKLVPVVEALTYQSFLWVEQMDSSIVERANKRFLAWKKGSIK